jgi:hypothetical protein
MCEERTPGVGHKVAIEFINSQRFLLGLKEIDDRGYESKAALTQHFDLVEKRKELTEEQIDHPSKESFKGSPDMCIYAFMISIEGAKPSNPEVKEGADKEEKERARGE